MAKRCMGHCCEVISLPLSPEEIENAYKDWVEFKEVNSKYFRKEIRNNKHLELKLYRDIHLLYPMLRFINSSFYHHETKKKGDERWYHYKCIHFNTKKRNCEIYNIRPHMCRIYGEDNHICMNPKCQWDKQLQRRKDKIKKDKEFKKKISHNKKIEDLKNKIKDKDENHGCKCE